MSINFYVSLCRVLSEETQNLSLPQQNESIPDQPVVNYIQRSGLKLAEKGT